jgi:hypothetical protein
MASYFTWSFDKEQREDEADNIKMIVMSDLVKQGLIDNDVADEYCENTTILLRKKTMFRTISEKWKKTETAGERYFWVPVQITKEKTKQK